LASLRRACFRRKDVRSDDSVAACVKAIAGQVGRLDVLINNAGYVRAGALEELSLDEAKLQMGMMDRRQVAAERIREYDPWRQRAFSATRKYEEKGPGPELVAETVLEIISSKTPRLRYVIGRQAKLVSRLRRFLPAGAYEQGIGNTFALDKGK